MGHFLLAAALAMLLAGLWPGRQRVWLAWTAVSLLAAATALLAFHFLSDDFSYRQVWLQSAPQLAWWLKLAGLWSGDEGTLLLLATLSAALALRLRRHGAWPAFGALLGAAVFTGGALVWSPFVATDPEQLAQAPYRGMNAHLTSPWMLVHPPLVFLSYLLLILPAGAAFGALARDDAAWRAVSGSYMRGAWLLTSAGIAFGMWWAYEDFTYGTLWHWDPVQTAVFATWCYLTALLHGQTRYRPGGDFALAHPLLGLVTAVSAVLTMAVTRSEALASSHRYVGETSLPLFLGLAGGLALATLAALLWRSRRPRPAARGGGGERRLFLWLAIILFVTCGGVAQLHLATAYWSAYQELPRPDSLKPFFETLRNFTSGAEITALRAAFAQWDVDNFGLNRLLTPLLVLVCLAGGYFLLPFARRWRLGATSLAAGLALVSVYWGKPFHALYEGAGLTSGKTVAIFPWLDALSVTLAFFLIAALLALVARLRAKPASVSGPAAVIHAGIMVALIGGLSATVLDGYWQQFIKVPDQVGVPIAFPGGYRVEIGGLESGARADGMRGDPDQESFRSIGSVGWSLERDGKRIDGAEGHTVYRDARPPLTGDTGAVRLMCEIVDYRFARYRSEDRQMIHPLISRGFLQDVQIWLPGVPRPAVAVVGAEGATGEAAGTLPVILKVYPLVSLVWIGLVAAISGAAVEFWRALRRPVTRAGRSA